MAADAYEKRAYERYPADMSIWVKPLETEAEFYLLESVNISAGGLLFKLDAPLKPDTDLDMRFELPQHIDLVEAVARVRRVEPNDEGTYLIGVQFIQVRNHTVTSLIAYLEALFK